MNKTIILWIGTLSILFYGQLDLTELYCVIKNAYFIHILIQTNRKFYTKKKKIYDMFYDFILLDTIVTCYQSCLFVSFYIAKKNDI